MSRATG
ncbi:hypothetical protein CGCSCA1_v014312 [Colletotrichum siamense]|nr:hypothetical protein CGCSCA1_v014312 [Colletotrichum siamense]